MTRPYPARRILTSALVVLLWLGPAFATASDKKPTKPPSSPVVHGRERLSVTDANTKSGFVHLYNLEYDQAIADFSRARQEHPNDLSATNRLLQAVLLKELYRL